MFILQRWVTEYMQLTIIVFIILLLFVKGTPTEYQAFYLCYFFILNNHEWETRLSSFFTWGNLSSEKWSACCQIKQCVNCRWSQILTRVNLIPKSPLLFSHPVISECLWPHRLQHARPPCPSPSLEVCPSSSPFCFPLNQGSAKYRPHVKSAMPPQSAN